MFGFMDVHHNADPDIHEELLNYICTQKDILTCMMCHIFFPVLVAPSKTGS